MEVKSAVNGCCSILCRYISLSQLNLIIHWVMSSLQDWVWLPTNQSPLSDLLLPINEFSLAVFFSMWRCTAKWLRGYHITKLSKQLRSWYGLCLGDHRRRRCSNRGKWITCFYQNIVLGFDLSMHWMSFFHKKTKKYQKKCWFCRSQWTNLL